MARSLSDAEYFSFHPKIPNFARKTTEETDEKGNLIITHVLPGPQSAPRPELGHQHREESK